MGKCAPCRQNKCRRSYKNRKMCADPRNCNCTCQEPDEDTFLKGLGSIAGGVLAVAGGVAATIMTGGAAAVVLGGVMIGGGSSMITNPVFKKVAGERVTGKDWVTDVAMGATVGVVTGGVGAGGSALAKGATGATKVVATLGTGAVAGAAGGAVAETANVVQGGEASVASYAKAMSIGAVGGAAGGASAKLAGTVSQTTTNGVAKAVTRVAVQTAAGGVCATTFEAYEAGGLDKMDSERWAKVGMATATQAVVAGTYDCTRNMVIKTEAYANKMGKADLKRLSNNVVEEQVKKVNEHTELTKQLRKQETSLEKIKQDISNLDTEKNSVTTNPAATREDKASIGKRYNSEMPQLRENEQNLAKEVETLKQKRANMKPGMIGDKKNIHFLRDDLAGKVAIDRPDPGSERRGKCRSVFTPGKDGYQYDGHTTKHDYKNLHKYGRYSCEGGYNAVNAEILKETTKHDDEHED